MIYSSSTIYSSLTHDRGSCDNGEVLLSAWKEMRIKFRVKKNWGASISHEYQGFDSYPCMMCHGQNMVYGLLASNHEIGNPQIGHCD